METRVHDAPMYLGRDPYAERSVATGQLVRLIERHGIARAVIAPLCETPGPVSGTHETLAEAVARYPRRFIPLARIDPRVARRV